MNENKGMNEYIISIESNINPEINIQAALMLLAQEIEVKGNILMDQNHAYRHYRSG